MSTVTTERPRTGGSSGQKPRGGRLWWQLIRIGAAAGRGTPGDRLRFWSLLAAAVAVALVILGATAALATYDGREARNQARGPLLTDRQRDAVALWREAFDTAGEIQHTVIYLQPLKPDAPPPPGLSHWPAPGEAVLSPELVRAGKPERITSRYGHYAGTIAKEGLVSPSERFAYVRPAHAPDPGKNDSWWYVKGFGQSYPMGETLNSRPVSHVLLALGGLTGVPAIALLVVASRVGSRTRDRRSSLLQALGGTWLHRAVVNIGEATLPVAAGTALAILPALAAMTTDVRIPPTGYLLDSDDLRSAWGMMAIALVLSFAITLGVVVLLHRVERNGAATRPRSFSTRIPRWRTIGCGVGVSVVAFSQYLSGAPGLFAFVGGTVAMWALLPSVAAVASRRLGNRIAARGFRTGSPGQLIGGRWTAAHPGVVVRLSLAMVIGLGLVGQLQVWNSRLGDKAAAARASEARVGDTVLGVRGADLTSSGVEELSRSLPTGSHLLVMKVGPEQQTALLQGSCGALKSLGLACPVEPTELAGRAGHDKRVAEIRAWYGPDPRFQATPAAPRFDGTQDSLVVVSPAPGARAKVKQAAYELVPAVTVETPGETWLVGAANKARLTNWVLLFGLLGLALLLLAGSLSAAAEFGTVRHALAPLSVLTGGLAVFRSVAKWHLTVPLLISACTATVITAWHSLFFISVVQEGYVSWGALAVGACGCAVLAVVVGVLAGRSATRAAQRWRPTAD
ncbi:permease [Streptomyces sp. NPDC056831]|uniref:permease n=1 Tax=Streptomyces sp. NPDC056831 TaxID=3345954 RepID=UPI0036A0AC04